METRGGDEDSMAVDDVGTGVGYVTSSVRASRFRLRGRGSVGDEENGSKAGRRCAGGFFRSVAGESKAVFRLGDGAMVEVGELDSQRARVH